MFIDFLSERGRKRERERDATCLEELLSDNNFCCGRCILVRMVRADRASPNLDRLQRPYGCTGFEWCMMYQQRQNSRKGNFGSSNARVLERELRYSWQGLFYRYSRRSWLNRTADFIRGRSTAVLWVMSQQRQNSRKDNFGSSNARVLERDLRYSWQDLFYRYSWRSWLTRTADPMRGRSTAVLFNIWKLVWSSYLMKN